MICEKNKEIWHYTCENNHKWKSLQSPRGAFIYGESGQTKCPVCKSSICQGHVYINGKYAQMGAMHSDFKFKNKKWKKKKLK